MLRMSGLPLTSKEVPFGLFLNLGDLICEMGIMWVPNTLYKILVAKYVLEFVFFQISGLCLCYIEPDIPVGPQATSCNQVH